VVGNVTYTNDFGDPRPGGSHEGNDLMSRRHQPAIAFEGGRVQKHVGSSIGTCMLYLHGKSGMTYVYIHLNNDLGPTNDNDGGCRNGVSWPKGLQNGDYVRRGELVGYVGDSGDANGIQPHLHFEIRTPSGRPINPYPYLREAKHLLYPRPAGNSDLSLTLRKSTIL
jgi:peptidoglycan LD-endopeptidase LytH